MPAAVVVIGSFNVDHVWTVDRLPRPGETLAGRYRSGPGGKGFNQAVAARRAGAGTRFACALGRDPGAELALSLAADEGIEMLALRVDEATGTAGIQVDATGRNRIVIGAGANARLDAAHIGRVADRFEGARVVLAQLETPVDAVMAGFAVARDRGMATILNPAPADAGVPDALWALTDFATPNETEFSMQLKRCCGLEVDADTLAAEPDASLHALCRRLLPAGTVIVTLGAAGVFASRPDAALPDGDPAWLRVAAPRVEAIDTTGAGDAFNGALAAALSLAPGRALEAQLRDAVRFASLSTEKAGAALAMPLRSELRARFATDEA
ncbi:ribokinase [Marilutibacter aestuarii]|uniref:Ribokinase n=1 Tax=Marilutibacter aestuarii TaxID=1706195 RepID=A0A508A6R2_9GAMM|nr:ribokinase [Lysobacter aestuarii]TQD45590.1 ribokinase [Lysobacter aestuarii]